MSSLTTPFSSGALLHGRYRLLGAIGQGGMATVYRARDEVLQRLVAVKLLHPHLAHDPAFVDRFQQEAQNAASMSHPNVVAVYDSGRNRDGAWLVLELVEGDSLRDVLEVRGHVSPGEALALLTPAARGLAQAHRQGLVHRDVKPENVLIGRDGRVKITDFGLMKAAASAHATFGADVIVGSPHYLSPEAVSGEPLDARADVYALGIMLYECLTGRPPFEGDSPMATALQHTSRTVPRPSDVVPGLAEALDEVVATATAADPDERYADAAAFADALEQAVPEGPSPVDIRDGRRSTIVLPLDAPETVAQARSRERRRDRGRDHRRAPREPRWGRRLAVFVLLLALAAGGWTTWDRVLAPVTPVPDVLGLPHEQARAALSDAGFSVAPVEEQQFSREIPRGSVLGYEPADRARRGSTVELVLSLGPRPVDVPDVRGVAEAQAVERLRQVGLEPQATLDFDEEIPAGQAVRTDPPAGETVNEGDAVTLVVSQGRRPIQLPDLVGARESVARQQLDDLGLESEVVERRYADGTDEDEVLEQAPGPGEVLFGGDVVQLVVSDGPAPVEVPDVEGRPVDEATAVLEGAGLQVRVEEVPTILFFRRGTVQEQDPQPGGDARRGDEVVLYAWS